ncbi:hypothetical protein DXT76_16050 [Halobacillus trueperi]|uniref:Uncharacterized protein n=1 Tax=Halobacillus trueperi TaxID=156205 RepID=A0A3D8VKH3_9BACI|nr:hypothetical protein [Halobacillus trueperi]RDY69889.1 hypothetical protein DXT76_16050 [Halobacillus trueperi]
MINERLRKVMLIALPFIAVATLLGVGWSGAYLDDGVDIGNVILLISILGGAALAFLSLLFRKKTRLVTGMVITFFLVTPAVFYFVNKPTTTTFEEAMPDEISDAQVVTEMTIYDEKERQFKSVTLENLEEIKKILQSPSSMTLVTTDEGLSRHLYSIYLKGDSYEDEVRIIVGDDALRIMGSMDGEDLGAEYEVEGQNSLLQMIENADFKWEKGS